MQVVVVGGGSIGTRHARLLSDLGCHVSVVSARDVDHPCYRSLQEAISAVHPEYVVVANRTSDHLSTVMQLETMGYSGTLLVEKPLFHEMTPTIALKRDELYVAYNLRFHPLLVRLCQELASERCLSAQIYVGQYLPTWRPGTDYRECYSAHKLQGGGVLRDLSHELDYVNWLFGGWQGVFAHGGRYSSLEIDSDDIYALLLSTERCPTVSVQLNYLDRVGRREILVNTDSCSIRVDLTKGVFERDGRAEFVDLPRDYTYREQHKAILFAAAKGVCTYTEGLEVLALIDAAERSSKEKRWITRN